MSLIRPLIFANPTSFAQLVVWLCSYYVLVSASLKLVYPSERLPSTSTGVLLV
jgi:hypothetical protein